MKKKSISRAFGYLLILIGLILNKGVLGKIISPDGKITSVPSIVLIVFFDVFCILIGIAFVIGSVKLFKEKIFPSVKLIYHSIAVVLIFFAIINTLSFITISKINKKTILDKSISQAYLDKDERYEILKKVYGVDSIKEIEEVLSCRSKVSLHPVLQFSHSSVRRKGCNIGIDGLRYYSDDWEDSFVKDLLISGNTIFIFGGSTTFGDLVYDIDSWPYYLNELTKKKSIFSLNFGVAAYDQHREIDKLLYLLKKGYRPKKVIFFDGLNDRFSLIYANYNISDHYNKYGFFVHRQETMFLSNIAYSWRDFALTLPFKKYWSLRKKNLNIYEIKMEKDGNLDKFDFVEAEFIGRNPLTFYKRNPSYFHEKILGYYKVNIEFLDKISKAFDFEYYMFFQPIGLLDENNPFIKFEDFKKTETYAFTVTTQEVLRENIKNGNLKMYDVSQIFEDKKGHNYVDSTHYSPKGNKIIAETVYKIVFGKNAK